MSFRGKHRWTRRILVGLAFGVIAAPAQALPAESTSPELGPRQAPQPNVISYLSHGITGEALKSSSSTKQPVVISYLSHGMTAADVVDSRAGGPQTQASPDVFDRAVARSRDDAPVRPDDRADRFVVSDGTPAVPSVDDGFTVAWENGLPFGIGALALALALGLAVAYRRRPHIAGL